MERTAPEAPASCTDTRGRSLDFSVFRGRSLGTSNNNLSEITQTCLLIILPAWAIRENPPPLPVRHNVRSTFTATPWTRL